MNLSDTQLIHKTKAGDQDAFREIVKRYESQVASTVIGMLGPGPDAEDVGQETFIRFYKTLTQFRGDAGLGTYLTRIAINLSLNTLKRKKRKRFLFRELSGENLPDIHDSQQDSIYSEERELVQKAIQQLDPKFRSVVVLRMMKGYSTKETAHILKLPVGTVLSRLARAQKKLRHFLTPFYGENHEQKNARSVASIL